MLEQAHGLVLLGKAVNVPVKLLLLEGEFLAHVGAQNDPKHARIVASVRELRAQNVCRVSAFSVPRDALCVRYGTVKPYNTRQTAEHGCTAVFAKSLLAWKPETSFRKPKLRSPSSVLHTHR